MVSVRVRLEMVSLYASLFKCYKLTLLTFEETAHPHLVLMSKKQRQSPELQNPPGTGWRSAETCTTGRGGTGRTPFWGSPRNTSPSQSGDTEQNRAPVPCWRTRTIRECSELLVFRFTATGWRTLRASGLLVHCDGLETLGAVVCSALIAKLHQ